jgi:hypothetical protein
VRFARDLVVRQEMDEGDTDVYFARDAGRPSKKQGTDVRFARDKIVRQEAGNC